VGINPNDMRRLIRSVLHRVELWSPEAETLLLGTAAVESGLGSRLYQIGHGPARGIMQMEPATERSLWQDYLAYRPRLRERIEGVTALSGHGPWLAWDLAYQIIMARIKYRTIPEPLPGTDDVAGQARYWKQWYNTPAGAGRAEDYVKAVKRLIR